MSRSKTATLFELDCILHRATKLTDRNFTIFPPSDEEGNLLLDETIEYYKKEIIKTINQIKTEEPQWTLNKFYFKKDLNLILNF